MNSRLLSLLLATFASSAFAASDAPPPPVDTPAPAAEAGDSEVEVRIINEDTRTIAEYRSHGKLYMVKVTPKNGKPYYLIDEEGSGNFTRREGATLSVPRWTLFEW
ncbi:DUF2782 domain-containing protein [Chitinilyticum piscinae]|uniref:DUF2782 domain-containing protein n=1 Tax=Chitinilyticum piscinae TaxID=2866724 RepID=A0A8J7K7N3_9NEIS|nr:DUF2782 domain-containing protein [Chitinilyticum piscinae]MBE9608338.1 DUF2782 domain-containing protein [Chitinilyticum piscinae]